MTPPLHGLAGIKEACGEITVAGGLITAPRGWESAHMVVLHLYPDRLPHPLYVNRILVEPLTAAFDACFALDDGYEINAIGCFNPRPKRVNGDLSTHSWGLAVDINPDTNPLTASANDPIVKDIPDEWIAIWTGIGWIWGGHFDGRKDPMHFQWVDGY